MFPIDKAKANLAELVAGLNDFLLGGAAGGRLVFSFESSGQVGPKIRYNLCDKVNFVGVLKEVPTPFYTVGLIHIHNSHILYQPA